jgi:hypothetical protein
MNTNDFARGSFSERMVMIRIADEKELREYCNILILQAEAKKLIRQRNLLDKRIKMMKEEISRLNYDFENFRIGNRNYEKYDY